MCAGDRDIQECAGDRRTWQGSQAPPPSLYDAPRSLIQALPRWFSHPCQGQATLEFCGRECSPLPRESWSCADVGVSRGAVLGGETRTRYGGDSWSRGSLSVALGPWHLDNSPCPHWRLPVLPFPQSHHPISPEDPQLTPLCSCWCKEGRKEKQDQCRELSWPGPTVPLAC